MRASQLLVRCLENEGVKYIFSIPGEETMDIVDALSESSMQYVVVRHEQGAAFMADVWGRLTGIPGVVLATLGPGATNTVTAVADAFQDRSPMVVITGQASLVRVHQESHQYLDTVSMLKPMTKWSHQVNNPQSIPEVVRKAFKIAETEKRGPVHLEFPEDVTHLAVEAIPMRVMAPPRPAPAQSVLAQATDVINAARCPMIFVGNGVIRERAVNALRAFVETTGIPVVNTFMAKGVLPFDHPLNLQTMGLQMKDYVAYAFDKADLIITIGFDYVEYQPHFFNPQGKPVVHIDTAMAEVDVLYPLSAEVVGNIKTSLIHLAETVRPFEKPSWLKKLGALIRQEAEPVPQEEGRGLKPQTVLWHVAEALGPEGIAISDVGAHKLWVSRIFKAPSPNSVIVSNGFAAMGIALPGAIAAKLAHPSRPVVAITGDGGFMMNVQEIETAKRLGLSFVVIIFNDNLYGVIDWKLKTRYDRSYGVSFTNPDFETLADSFGVIGMKVRTDEELPGVLAKAFAANDVVIVDVAIDPSENFNLTKRLKELSLSI